MNLDCFRIYDDATLPEKATAGSACFDLTSYLREDVAVTVYDMSNQKIKRLPEKNSDDKLQVYLDPADRVLIPTGLIFKVPFGYSIRLHTRSSTSLKKGLIMPNGEGIIDSDYYHQTYIMLMNTTADTVMVDDRERIAQGEMIQTEHYHIEETLQQPEQVTERVGGFGSTGTE